MARKRYWYPENVVEVDDKQNLWIFNTLPSQSLVEKADKVERQDRGDNATIKWEFKLDSHLKVVFKKTKDDIVKILQSSKTLAIPNYVLIKKVYHFKKDINGNNIQGSSFRIKEMQWFYNKRKIQTVSNVFMIKWLEYFDFPNSVLIAPSEDQSELIKNVFTKEPAPIKCSITNLCSMKDLYKLKVHLEESNSLKALLAASKDQSESVNFGGSPTLMLTFKEPIQINEYYKVLSASVAVNPKGFRIEELIMNQQDIINFNFHSAREKIYARDNRIKSLPKNNTNETTHVIEYKNDVFPIQIKSVQLALFYSKCGAAHKFKMSETNQLKPKRVVNYSSLPPPALNNGKVCYHTMAYIKKFQKELYKKIHYFLSEHNDLSNDDVIAMLMLNFQPVNYIENVVRHNMEIHQHLMHAIEAFNQTGDVIALYNDIKNKGASIRIINADQLKF